MASIINPQPTMIRNVKNGMTTGGRSWGGKSVKPTSLEVKLMLATNCREPRILLSRRSILFGFCHLNGFDVPVPEPEEGPV
jgi:hypothetical protein